VDGQHTIFAELSKKNEGHAGTTFLTNQHYAL